MANVSAVISNIRNIMRQDRGISGDAQRLEQLGWMLFLKIMDDKDQELEVIKDNYVSVIPEKFRWRNWAKNPEGITGDELINFIDSNELTNKGLFLTLRELKSTTNPKRAMIVKEVFDGTNNYMKSGYEMRKVINKLNEIDFTKSEDKHVFGNIYESILQELRDAGNKGEYYTPRAVTQLMTTMTDPKLGEKVLDPAAGTGGFLSAAIDHVRNSYVKTVDDEALLQNSITGWELKPVAYVLGLTNLILHEIDVPDYHYIDSLKKEYNSIGKKDQVDVILANPPFGASIADGVETNFPATYRCKESADLFVVLMLQLLKPNGRCAIVLPDGSITGDGIKARIREKLLTDCNLHTIIRLPQSTFFPANVPTNLLFFEKGTPTKEIWYYEHKLPEGQKSYSKKKPINFEEFQPIINWWHNRIESDISWKVNFDSLNNFDLDIKNPTKAKLEISKSEDLYPVFQNLKESISNDLSEIFNQLGISNHILYKSIKNIDATIFAQSNILEKVRYYILKQAMNCNLTSAWREAHLELEYADILFKMILKDKLNLIKEGVIKKEAPLSPLEKFPYPIPKSWKWCSLGEVCTKVTDGFHHTPQKLQSGRIYVSPKHLKNNKINWQSCDFISEEDHKYLAKKTTPKKGEILIANRGTIGVPAIIDIEEEFSFQNLALIGFNQSLLFSKYVYYYIQFKRQDILDYFANGGLQPMLSNKILKTLPFPLPPISEQQEIISKVEDLFLKCDNIERQILQYKTNSSDLVLSMLNEVFENKSKVCQD